MSTTRAERNNLTPTLRKRALTKEEIFDAFTELLDHLGILKRFEALHAGDDRDKAEAYRELALTLMEAFVPVFRSLRPRNRKPSEQKFSDDWRNAGGTIGLLGIPVSPTEFYQAQFVEAITKLQKERKSGTRMVVFRWLANKAEITSPEKAKQRLGLLPERFRSRKKVGSLKEAWDSIPLKVRESPTEYLPRTSELTSGLFGFLSGSPVPPSFGRIGLLGGIGEKRRPRRRRKI
jgi:hypothetical protein